MEHIFDKEHYIVPSHESIQHAKIISNMVSALPDPDLLNNPEGAELFSLTSYIKFIREFLQLHDIAAANLAEAIMPDKVLKARLSEIDYDSHLKSTFIEGYTCRVVPIPCDLHGYLCTLTEIIQGDYIRNLIIENGPRGMTLRGFLPMNTYIHKIMPTEFDECSFIVEKYDSPQPYEITNNDRERLKRQYSDAYTKAKEVLKKSLTK